MLPLLLQRRRRFRRWFIAVSLVSSVVACEAVSSPRAALAQPTAKPRTSEDEARARFNEGVAFAEASDHEAARLKFSQAWALMKSPVILYNLARAENLSGHPVESLEHYRLFMKMNDPKITEKQRTSANETMSELARKVAQISIEAPANTRVTVDGKPIDDVTEPVPVSVGKHTVDAMIDNKGRTVTIDCPAGVVTKAKLVPDEKATPTNANANGNGNTNHSTVEPPKEIPPGFWSTGRIIGVSAAGVGLVGVGLGVVFHLGATNAESDATDIRKSFPAETRNSACSSNPEDPTCKKLKTALDDQSEKEGLRTAFLIGGGALFLGGALLFVLSGPSSSSAKASALQVVPIASANQAGATLVGRF